MAQFEGSVEFLLGETWYDLFSLDTLLLNHSDLSGCLFGVDNYAGYAPLFANRGLPTDCSNSLRTLAEEWGDEAEDPSWVLWSELKRVDWDEPAEARDRRISQFTQEGNKEVFETKWLGHLDWDWVRDALDKDADATVRSGPHIFRRVIAKRTDALEGTDFPLVMKLMATLAERFGDENVRMTVWFS
jgi:hypothetical protein